MYFELSNLKARIIFLYAHFVHIRGRGIYFFILKKHVFIYVHTTHNTQHIRTSLKIFLNLFQIFHKIQSYQLMFVVSLFQKLL